MVGAQENRSVHSWPHELIVVRHKSRCIETLFVNITSSDSTKCPAESAVIFREHRERVKEVSLVPTNSMQCPVHV
jgi:hypothetical protein